MYFINMNNLLAERKMLSALGINVFHATKRKEKCGYPIDIDALTEEITDYKNRISKGDKFVFDDICYGKTLKNEVFFRYIWTCKTNIRPQRIRKIVYGGDKREILIQRLDFILLALTAARTGNDLRIVKV